MKDRAVVIIKRDKDCTEKDYDIPLDISVHELIIALHSIYDIRTDLERMGMMYLRAENPTVLLKGNRTLREYGLRDGSIIHIAE